MEVLCLVSIRIHASQDSC